MSEITIDQIIERIGEMTILEVNDLVKAIEEKFDVSAAAPVAMAGPMVAAGGEAAAEEEKDTFTVTLKDVGSEKIKVIKEVRAITGLGLKEAKELVEEAPKALKEDAQKDEAEEIKKKLEAVGAKVELS